jgi:hypothetical protein
MTMLRCQPKEADAIEERIVEEMRLLERSEPFGKYCLNRPVGVFVEATFPRVIGFGKIG